MSDRFQAIYRRTISDPLLQPGSRKGTQIALALCCFALPILLMPLAWRESEADLWVRSGLPQGVVEKVLIPSGAATPLYVLVAGRGVYRSTDTGTTWQAVNSGLPSAQWGSIAVQALAVDESQPSVLYAGMAEISYSDSAFGTGLYLTDDGGATWLALGKEMVGKEVQAIAVMPAPAVSKASTWDGTAPSRNDGADSSDVVCVATGGELYRSMDRGRSWSSLAWRGVDTRILSLAMHPGNPDTVYVGTEGSGIYGTGDGGLSWAALNEGLDDLDVYDIAVAVNEPRLMYLATNGGVYKSLNAGLAWTKLGGPTRGRLVNTIALHPQDGKVLYVGLRHGAAYHSMDGGTQWKSLNRGLGDLSVLSLALDPRNKSTLWGGTADGIWRYVFGAPAPSTTTLPVATMSATPRSDPATTETPTDTATPPLSDVEAQDSLAESETRTSRPSATASLRASPTNTVTATPSVLPTPSPTLVHTPRPTQSRTQTPTPTLTATAVPPPPTATRIPPPPTLVVPTPTETPVPR